MFVRPHLDYCDIYHIPTVANKFDSSIELNYSVTSIESTQYRTAPAVSGAWKGSNTSKLYEQPGGESLTDRRWYRRLQLFYKFFNNLTSFYLTVIIPSPRRNLYGQRSDNVLNEIVCRTSSFMHSFFPDSIKRWNVIGSEFRSLSTISLFKNSLLSLIRPTKQSLFGIYNPVGIKQIFQSRLGLSD